MVSLEKLDKDVLRQLRESVMDDPIDSSKDHELSSDSAEELFTRWCNYEGLINYGSKLIRVIDQLRAAEVK